MFLFFVDLPWVGILLATIASQMVGMLWYGPLFGNAWMRLTGITPDPNQNMAPLFAGAFVANGLVMIGIASVMAWSNITTWPNALLVTLTLWVTFMVGPYIHGPLWEDTPWGLVALNTGNMLVNMLIGAGAYLYFA